MLKYTFLWTWDHSMEWAPNEPGAVPDGCNNPYKKRPQAFLKDYKVLVDYASEHNINAVIIWGFLRKAHEGTKASQELCRYAKDKGVYVWPGVGTSHYGGFYYRSRHPFNLETWLKMHPELRATGKDDRPEPRLCPSKEENKEWLRAGTRWLYENFEVGGLNLEYGDIMVCYCRDCTKAREHISSGFPNEPNHYKDMAMSITPAIETAFEMDHDTLATYATYTGFDLNMARNPPSFVKIIPERAICQWTVTDMMDDEWPPELKPPTKHSTGFTHWGSQWWNNNTRHALVLNHIQLICRYANQAGLEGIGIQGEMPPEIVPNELNYLALGYFSLHPNADLEEYAEDILRDLFGGTVSASSLVRYLRMEDHSTIKENLKEIKEAQYREENLTDSTIRKRWTWLLFENQRRYFFS